MNNKLTIFIATHKEFDDSIFPNKDIYTILTNNKNVKSNIHKIINISEDEYFKKYGNLMAESCHIHYLYTHQELLGNYICFITYKRWFQQFIYNEEQIPEYIDKYGCCVNQRYEENTNNLAHTIKYLDKNLIYKFISIIKEHNIFDNNQIEKYLNSNTAYYFNIFILKKQDFIKMCNCIFPILDEFNNYYDLNVTNNNYEKYYTCYDNFRLSGYFSEFLISMYISINFEYKNKINKNFKNLPDYYQHNAILTLVDNEYFPVWNVMFKSFIENNEWFINNDNYKLVILTPFSEDLKDEYINYIKCNLSNVLFIKPSFTLNKICDQLELKENYYNDKRIYKLEIFNQIKYYKKVLMLDGDMIIQSNIEELFNLSNNNDIYGCIDLLYTCENNNNLNSYDLYSNNLSYYNDHFSYKEIIYINSGLILLCNNEHTMKFNLNNLTIDKNITHKCVSIYNNDFGEYGDQDIINYIIYTYHLKLNLLETKYNSFVFFFNENGLNYNDAKIIHYLVHKPWKDNNLIHMNNLAIKLWYSLNNKYNNINILSTNKKIINNIPIYFLSLIDNDEKNNNVKNQISFLKKYDINNYHIFYNYKWPESIISVLVKKYNFLKGAFSCVSGHYAIMKQAIYNNNDYIIICEDDINLTENFIYFYKNLSNIDFEFDYINLGSTSENNIKLTDKDVYNKHNDFFQVNDNIKMWRTSCYLVNKHFMIEYINYIDKYVTFADYPVNDLTFRKSLKIFFTDNNLIMSSKQYVKNDNFITSI